MSDVLRVGVVGGGLIAQTVHLPLLDSMRDRFRLCSIADPSERVRDGLASRHGGLRAFADWRQLIEAGGVDAVIVCSPPSNHADVVLAALDSGIHVLVEKPLCIDIADADAICERREATGLVVQVGYMKRFDPAFAALLDSLPEDARDLRLVEVVTRDPSMARAPFLPPGFLRAADLPETVVREGTRQEREQVEAVVGAGDAESVKAFIYTYLGALIHDVNLVHGVLERMGVELPLQAASSAHWAGSRAATASFQLPNGGAWNNSWLLLEGLEDFEEDARFFFGDQIHGIRFGVPYLRERPTVHEQITAADGTERLQRTSHFRDHYEVELESFHSAVTAAAPCRTPPEQARVDLVALREAFLIRRSQEPPNG
jgi:predicted dehydrogenase